MRHLFRNTIIVLIAVVIALWAVIPPSKTLRLGKDLAGGVSLVYAVNIEGGNKRDVMERIIDVLKNRIDPKGILEVSIVAQGTDRIEITMPLPTAHVKELKAAFEKQLDALGHTSMTLEQFQGLMRMDPAQRTERIKSLAGEDLSLLGALESAATKYDAWTSLEKDYRAKDADVQKTQSLIENLRSEGVSENDPSLTGLQDTLSLVQKELRDLGARVARAKIDYEKARGEVLRSSINITDVRRALELSDEPVRLVDNDTGEVVELPSARQRALTAIRDKHQGQKRILDQLDKVVDAWNTYESQRKTLDDPEDLKRLLRGAGVLSFRITVNPGEYPDEARLRRELKDRGPKNAGTGQVQWYRVNKIRNWLKTVQDAKSLEADAARFFQQRGYVGAEYNGEYYMLCWDTPDRRLTEADGQWGLESAFQTYDEVNRLAIGFTMDARGAVKLGQLTGQNQDRHMAVLLDDQVYTAPTLIDRISKRGRITGDFRRDEVDYIIRVLSAGSLQAKLSPDPISENTLAPTLGQDNLNEGLYAGVIALVTVSAFMILYYFFGGVVAVIGLVLNALFLVGAMALNRASFTLPGIAGIILTFGMAVDSNVLIYERIREELFAKADLKTAVRLGYQRALSSIVDGNVTNLIVCVVLGFVGTPEIKGFALTLGIGVVTTLFTALVVSRLLFSYAVDEFGAKRVPGLMLPGVVKAVDRLLTPNIDWLRLRGAFLTLSGSLILMTAWVVWVQGDRMLGTEFRGGTEVTISLKKNAEGEQETMIRPNVETMVQKIGDDAPPTSVLRQLINAEVLAVNPRADGFTASEFKVRSTITDADTLMDALTKAFAGHIESRPPLTFDGMNASDINPYALPITDRDLGADINRPAVKRDVSDYVGGVAILMQNLQPRPTLESLKQRITLVRNQPEYSDTLTRKSDVFVLDGTANSVVSAVMVVHDDRVSYFDDPVQHSRWKVDLQKKEWSIVNAALGRTTTLASVQSFSPAIARTFVAQAVVAVVLSIVMIVIYVWVRFGSLRYSLAAILTTVHDCVIVVGLIAIAEIIYKNAPGFAAALKIQPFKIDLNLIAAILTILGYSLNDTIIVMDRIRENRGKLPYASREVVNASINQTMSRTVITSGTTLLATLVLYIWGGEGVREFAYALLLGLSVGTYSSIAIASPLVWSGKSEKAYRRNGGEKGPPGSDIFPPRQ